MKVVTIGDVNELKQKFDVYTKTAEQHEFLALLYLDVKLGNSIAELTNEWNTTGKISNQKEARAMMRTILKFINEGYSDYLEGSE